MSGCHKGAQAQILAVNPYAYYVHCFSHRLSLAIMGTTSNIFVRDLWTEQTAIWLFFQYSPRRTSLLQQSIDELKCSSYSKPRNKPETRWGDRQDALDCTLELLPAFNACLDGIWTSGSRDATDAGARHKAIFNFSFLMSVFTVRYVLKILQPLVIGFQAEEMDAFYACSLIKNTIRTLEGSLRDCDAHHSVLYEEAVKIASKYNVQVDRPRTPKPSSPNISVADYYLEQLTKPFLADIIEELKTRFPERTQLAYEHMGNLFPGAITQLPDKESGKKCRDAVRYLRQHFNIAEIAEYDTDTCALMWNTHVHANKEKCGSLRSLSDICEYVHDNNSMVTNETRLLFRVLATLPVTSCTAERIFSSLRFIKNRLRSTMTEERLNDLMTMYLNQDYQIDKAQLLKEFLAKDD
jgi:hypothetical protein